MYIMKIFGRNKFVRLSSKEEIPQNKGSSEVLVFFLLFIRDVQLNSQAILGEREIERRIAW